MKQRISSIIRLFFSAIIISSTYINDFKAALICGIVYILLSMLWIVNLEKKYLSFNTTLERGYIPLLLDVLLLALLVWITGGTRSILIPGFVFISALHSSGSVKFIAWPAGILCSATFSLLVLALSLGLIPDYNLLGPSGDVNIVRAIISSLLVTALCLSTVFSIQKFYRQLERARWQAVEESQNAQLELVMSEKSRFEIETYNEFARKLNSTTSFDEIIGQIFDYIESNFHIEANYFYLLDKDASEFYHYKSRFPPDISTETIKLIQELRISMGSEGGVHWKACQRKRPAYFPKIKTSATELDRFATKKLQLTSLLIIPLFIQEEVFGIVDFISFKKRLQLTRIDIESISAFCEQIAGAVKSSLLLHEAETSRLRAEAARMEIEKSRKEIAQLNEISRKINSTSNLDIILDQIFSFIEIRYNIEGIWLQFIDPDNREMYTYKSTKPKSMDLERLNYIRSIRVPLSPEGGIPWLVYQRKRPFFMPRPPAQFFSELDRENLEKLEIKSCLFVPLVINNEVIAIISFTKWGQIMHLAREDIKSITRFCDQIAGAINNSRLHTDSEFSRMIAEQRLIEVQALKSQQDLDYYLTSNLIEPLTGIQVNSKTVTVEQLARQKKSFKFRRWHCEIGGDINLAKSVLLKGRPYTVFLNADAMGKSIQGGGGILVLGSAFRIIVDRTPKTKYQYPEQWLKNTHQELDSIFQTFDGSMYITLIVGIIDDATGWMYFINAEHPMPVMFRNGRSTFITHRYKLHKLGFLLGKRKLAVEIIQLNSGDMFFCGSDGRDDIMIRNKVSGALEINEDENLFLTKVDKGNGDIQAIYESIRDSGSLTDDISLLKISYNNILAQSVEYEITPQQSIEIAHRANQQFQMGDFAGVISQLEAICKRIIETGNYLPVEYRLPFDDLFLTLIGAFLEVHESKRALEMALAYIDLNPGCTMLIHKASLCARLLDDLDLAADLGERVRLREPDFANNLANLTEVYIAMKNNERAGMLLEQLTALNYNEYELSLLNEHYRLMAGT